MNPLTDRIRACKREVRARSVDGIERRTFPSLVEARTADDGSWQVVGHGIVYNSLSGNLGGFREQIAEGAAEEVLAKSPDIRGLINHNPDLVLGRTIAGTMTVEDDAPNGVRYVIDAPDTSYANDLRVSLERGDITQSSFAFRVARGGEIWEEDSDTGLLIRTVTKFSDLFDMSPVTYAAYEQTDVGAASTDVGASSVAITLPDGRKVSVETPSPDSEREAERVVATTADMAEAGATGGISEGLSREFMRRDLAARGRLLDA